MMMVMFAPLCLAAACGSAPSANVAACRDFARQGAYMKTVAAPGLLVLSEFDSWAGEDAQSSTGTLSRQFTALQQDLGFLLAHLGQHPSAAAMDQAGAAIGGSCQAIGVSLKD